MNFSETSAKQSVPFQGMVPVKWLAIESIKDSIFTEKSDV